MFAVNKTLSLILSSSCFTTASFRVSRLMRRWIKLSPDDPYLSYHDVRLMKEDVDTLKDDWLTDTARLAHRVVQDCLADLLLQIIAFWEEYLEREYLSQYKNAQIVLLRPSMSFMLIQTRDPLTLKEALPNFARTTHIFLPINDCGNPEVPEGGTHWSLLVVSVVDSVAFHYDSLNHSNRNEAHATARKIGQLIERSLRFIDLPDSPQQENSSDCGVFVCIQMRHLLLKRLLAAHAQEKVDMSMGGKNVDAVGGRKEMLRIIEEFRKEGERRRSRSISRETHLSKSPPRIE